MANKAKTKHINGLYPLACPLLKRERMERERERIFDEPVRRESGGMRTMFGNIFQFVTLFMKLKYQIHDH